MCINDSVSYQKVCACHLEECARVGHQCVDVSVPVEVAPIARVGEITTTCQGMPTVTCRTEPHCNVAVVTVTQELCLTIPVCYGLNTAVGQPTICCVPGSGSCCCGA